MVKRIRAARHYQSEGDPVLRLARSGYRSVARSLRNAFGDLSSMAPVNQLTDALKHGSNPASVVNWHHYREVLRGPFTRLGKIRHAGGELGARKINGSFNAKRRQIVFRKRQSTKAEANYRKATVPRETCGDCWMFEAPQSCCAVSGVIDSRDTCDFFETIWAKQDTSVIKDFDRWADDGGPVVEVPIAKQFNFDSFSPDIQAEIRAAQDALIQQLESDARDAIDTIIRDGTLDGTPLEEVASNIRDLIGLTDGQAQAALNYQDMLQSLDSGALARQLRNPEYDAVLQDAIDTGVDLSDAAIQNMVDDYISNYLDYRAATIAQTESTRAANAGLHDAYSQAVDRGALPDGAITRQWQLGDAPCPICESIPDNNPEGVGLDEPFDSDDGPIDDPPVHPNCECSVEYITNLDMVPDDSGEEDYIGPGSFGPGGVNTPYMDDEG